MEDICSVTMVGRIGQDPYANDADTMLRLRLANSYDERTREGSYEEHTLWIDAVIVGKNLSWLAANVRKGMRVAVSGRLRANKFERKDGTVVDSIEIVGFGSNALQIMDRFDPQSGKQKSDVPPSAAPKAAPVDDELPF